MNSDDILNGAKKALIDKSFNSQINFKPTLLLNNDNNKLVDRIQKELRSCDKFKFSTAFINENGIKPFLQIFEELDEKNVKGQILTTDYLYFTDPKAIRSLNRFKNIEVRIYKTEKNDGFHTKGYLFRKHGICTGIVGSSNLTGAALNINQEWNIGFTSEYDGELLVTLNNEFNRLWNHNQTKSLDEYLSEYEVIYRKSKSVKEAIKITQDAKLDSEGLKPNSMQNKFLENLSYLVEDGEDKAILVSATGTGKTYASAFAVRQMHPKKFLFLVHRQQIAEQALEAYKKVFKDYDDISFGVLGGGKHETGSDFLFATFQSMNSQNRFLEFERNEFDFIVVDEVHRAAADTYKNIIEYFEPKFLLGMSATPWRNDSKNKKLFELFDDNIVYQVTLQDALDEDLLCPFHYYGISDLKFEGNIVNDDFDSNKLNTNEKKLFSKRIFQSEIDDSINFEKLNLEKVEDKIKKFRFLTSDERVRHILEKSEGYGFSGDRIKALVFCSSVIESKILAKKFNELNHPSIALDGSCTFKDRENAIDRLVNDDNESNLEYIFTYDIFNEGVDIPEVNQVILIRSTKSSIVFVQQLGRGLRKAEDKEYVIILDFIGSYKNNYMIPIALSGMKNYSKDELREYVIEGNKYIPGASSISFDKVSRKEIFKSIDSSNFSQLRDLREKYHNLKRMLGRRPLLCDIFENDEFDALLIFNKVDCYHNFLIDTDKQYKEEFSEFLSDKEIALLKFVSKRLSNGIRPHELIILKSLMYNKYFLYSQVVTMLDEEYSLKNQHDSIKSALNYLNLSFYKKMDGNYQNDLFSSILKIDGLDYENLFFKSDFNIINNLEENLNYQFQISDEFNKFLTTNSLFRDHFEDLINFALLRYESQYSCGSDLKLYSKYTTEDVMRVLNWSSRVLPLNMGGHEVQDNAGAIFVTYEKNDDRSESTKYPDLFIDRTCLDWTSTNPRYMSSPDLIDFINYQNNETEFYLFVQKSKNDSDFYFVGKVDPIEPKEITIPSDNGAVTPVVNFKLKLHDPLDEKLYDYFITDLYSD